MVRKQVSREITIPK